MSQNLRSIENLRYQFSLYIEKDVAYITQSTSGSGGWLESIPIEEAEKLSECIQELINNMKERKQL